MYTVYDLPSLFYKIPSYIRKWEIMWHFISFNEADIVLPNISSMDVDRTELFPMA